MRRLRVLLPPADLVALSGLCAAWAAFFWRVITPDPAQRLQFVGRDLALQFFVIRQRAYAQFLDGAFPLIEPCIYGGYPLHADPQAQLFYPPQWLAFAVARVLGFAEYPFRALEWEVLLHALFGTLAMYTMLRGLRGTPRPDAWAAAFGALTWGFGGFMTGYVLDQFALLATAVWVPVLMLMVNRLAFAKTTADATRFVIATAAGAYFAFTSGNTQLMLHAGYAAGGMFCAWCVQARLPARQVMPRIFITALLAFGLCAPALLPQLQFALGSTRASAEYGALAQGFAWADLGMLAGAGGAGWWGLHIGLAGLIAALAGFALAPRAALPWAVLALLALLLSLGGNGPLFAIAYHVLPGYGLFRQQERHAMLFALAMAPLAALGLQMLRSRLPANTTMRAFMRLIVPSAVLVMQGAGLFAAHRNNPLATGSPAASVPLPGHIAPLVNAAAPYPVGQTRIYSQFGLDLNWACGNGLNEVRGGSPLEPATYVGLLQRAPESVLLRILHARYASSWRQDYATEQGVPIPSRKLASGDLNGQPAHLFALDWQPQGDYRAWVAVRSSTHASPDALFARMRAADYDSLGEALVYAEDAAGLVLEPSPNRATTVLQASPAQWRVEAFADAPTVLVFSLAHLPGWQATVDGAPVRVMRVDHALVGVPIPAGTSQVALTYSPLLLQVAAGGALFLAMFLAFVVFAATRIRQSAAKREGNKPPVRQ